MSEAQRKARGTLHLARPEDVPLEVARFDGESDSHYLRRCASIRALGVRWVGHSAYVFQPLHSVNPEVWKPAHALWWEQVHASAALTRAKSESYRRAQAVRDVVGAKP